MTATHPIRRRLRTGFAALALLAGVATLVYLASEVLHQLQRLNSATSDNIQWTLSQTEVDLLKLKRETEAAAAADVTLDGLRRSFDIFYSRVRTVESSTHFAAFRNDPDAAAALGAAKAFLSDAVMLIDGPDDRLRAALPQLGERAAALEPAVRRLALSGLEFFAAQGDAHRESIRQTLVWLAVATAALLSVLAVLAARLARLFRLSERQAAEQRQTGARLATIIDTSLEGVLVTDADGRIVEFNPAAEAIFGRRRADILGRNVADVLVPERHRRAHAADMAAFHRLGRIPPGAERRILEAVRADGTVIPVEVAVQAADGGGGTMLVASVRDISRRLADERALVRARDQAQAGERAKAAFVAQMSHEIRTPLNGLLGTLSLLAESGLTPRQQRYVRTMETSGRILLGHVSDVLDISRSEAGMTDLRNSSTDLGALVEEVVDNQRALAQAAGVRLAWQWSGPPLPAVRADSHRLRQIVMNLVGNAVKFTRDGAVTVTLRTIERDTATATVEIAVADQGCGISQENLQRVFRDFESGDSPGPRTVQGTGLGLGIVQSAAASMGGTVEAESVPGEGSVFRVRLPLQLADWPASAPAGGPRTEAAPALSVLVVEDNAVNREVLREMLEADGHAVVVAPDGIAGVEAAARKRFDLIFMDIAMPGMDGRTAARAIRSQAGASRAVRIVALTAHDQPGDPADWQADGIDGWLRKPIDRPLLRQVLAGDIPGPDSDHRSGSRAPVLDTRRYAALGEDLGEAARDRLLRRFIEEGETGMARLAALAAGPGEDAEFRDHLHKLCGGAAMFGAAEMEDVLRKCLARGPGSGAGLGTVQAAWSRLRAELVPLLAPAPDRAAG